jgi:hypothetical protein
MKKRLHDKKAGIAILLSLIIISVAEIIFRAVAMGKAVLTTANLGEQLAVIALAVTILILTAKGKDRACYICYGAWAGYFILNQLFELPGTISNLLANISNLHVTLLIVIRLLTMVCIIAIGVLLVEYMTDGTICNRAFNVLCVVTILLIAVDIFTGITQLVSLPTDIRIKQQNVLIIFNDMYYLTMVFLFTFFAYDSAKRQLKRENLTK